LKDSWTEINWQKTIIQATSAHSVPTADVAGDPVDIADSFVHDGMQVQCTGSSEEEIRRTMAQEFINSFTEHMSKSSITAATKIRLCHLLPFFFNVSCRDIVIDRVTTEQSRCFQPPMTTSYTAFVLSRSHWLSSSLTSVTVPTSFPAHQTHHICTSVRSGTAPLSTIHIH